MSTARHVRMVNKPHEGDQQHGIVTSWGSSILQIVTPSVLQWRSSVTARGTQITCNCHPWGTHITRNCHRLRFTNNISLSTSEVNQLHLTVTIWSSQITCSCYSPWVNLRHVTVTGGVSQTPRTCTPQVLQKEITASLPFNQSIHSHDLFTTGYSFRINVFCLRKYGGNCTKGCSREKREAEAGVVRLKRKFIYIFINTTFPERSICIQINGIPKVVHSRLLKASLIITN